jgi:hypothetical protein
MLPFIHPVLPDVDLEVSQMFLGKDTKRRQPNVVGISHMQPRARGSRLGKDCDAGLLDRCWREACWWGHQSKWSYWTEPPPNKHWEDECKVDESLVRSEFVSGSSC